MNSELKELKNLLSSTNIDNLSVCGKVAELYMKYGKNRNIIVFRKIITDYVACAVFRLASDFPVRICYPDNYRFPMNGIPVCCRTKTGDMAHLIVLLSEPPMKVLRYLFMDEQVIKALPQLYAEYTDGNTEAVGTLLNPVCMSATHLLTDNRISPWLKDSLTFRIDRTKVTANELIPASVFSWKDMTASQVVMRCQADLNLLLDADNGENCPSLAKLGTRLRTLREHMGLTQKQLGEMLGYNNLRCCAVENGGAVSAGVLFTFLMFYSRTVNIDILFNDRLWAMAQFDHDLLLKKVHIDSVINRSLKVLEKQMLSELTEIRMTLLRSLDALNDSVSKDIGAILRLTDEDEKTDDIP